MMKRFTSLLSTLLYLCMLIGMIVGIVWADVPDSDVTIIEQVNIQN